jgi:hypothetical protein
MPSLQDRLRRLRASTGVMRAPDTPSAASAADAGREPPPPTLAERIRRLSPVRTGARTSREPDPQALAESLGAEITAPGVLRLERRQPLRRRHGRIAPGRCTDTLAELMAGTGEAPPAPAGWAFLDTETSGLAGGTGTWAFVCGIARISGEDLVIRQYLLTRLDAEPAFIEQLADELAPATLLISYNGKTFDLPLLATRFQLAAPGRLTGALPPERPHLDLLHPVRRAFASRWPDCRLGTCEQRLLGLTRDGDLSGAEAPAAWLDWLRNGDGGRLGAVLRHNRIDLISLAALVPALAAVQQDPAGHAADVAALARHLVRTGRDAQARSILTAAGPALDDGGRLLLAALHRRRGDWAAAVALWQGLADAGQAAAIEQLAKYHEHVSGDVRAALHYAERLAASPEAAHRCARLRGRLAARGEDLFSRQTE